MSRSAVRLIPIIIFFLITLMVSAAPPVADPDAAAVRTRTRPAILALVSYDPSFPTSSDILDGIRDAFPPADYEVAIYFMDSKRIPGPEQVAAFGDFLRTALTRSAEPELVLTFDDNALRFALARRDQLFPGEYIVFAGVNDRAFALGLEDDALITGVIEAVSIADTVAAIIRLRPALRKLGVIVDGTESGKADLATLRGLDLGIDIEVIDLSAIPEADFQARLAGGESDGAFLLLSAYSGYSGRVYSFHEGLRLILAAAPAPIFHLWKHGVGEGLAGGKVVSQYEQATTAGALAKRLLNGETIETLPVIDESPNVFLFDWAVLKHYGMKRQDIPRDATLINPPANLFTDHPNLAWGLVDAGLAAAGVILLLAVIAGFRSVLAQRLRRNLAFLNGMIRAIDEPISLKDATGRYLMVNPGFARLTGQDESALIGKMADLYTDPAAAKTVAAMDDEALRDRLPQAREAEMIIKGEKKIVLIKKVPLMDSENRPVLLGTMRDLTADRLSTKRLMETNEELERRVAERTRELEKANRELAYLASTDQLTGLANRRRMETELENESARWERYGTTFSVISADLDHFKVVNDECGHDCGDSALVWFANLLRSGCRSTDLGGRWGGEEFLVLCRNAGRDSAAALAEKLRAAADAADAIPGRHLTASFGVAEISERVTVTELLKLADERMYAAKTAGRNRVVSA